MIKKTKFNSSLGLAVAVSLGLGGQMMNAQAEAIQLPGIKGDISMHMDALEIPHIQATTRNDAAFAQGWFHASTRIFQMDLTRRAASGTVAELVGSSVLADDIQARTLGLRRGAEASFRAASPEVKAWLKAYANGVNSYLANADSLPPEYGALELSRVEPWTSVDSIVIAKALAFQLSFDLDIDYTVKLTAFQTVGQIGGFDGVALFTEDANRIQPPDDRLTAPGFLGISSNKSTADKSVQLAEIDPNIAALAESYKEKIKNNPFFAKALNPENSDTGSNWWMVNGTVAANGNPILANDPHLSLNYPSIFVEAHLKYQQDEQMVNTSGVTVPGAPGIIQGCAQIFCWGSTVHPMDVTDTFAEKLKTNNFGLPTHTIYKGKAEPIIWIYQSYYANQLDGVLDNPKKMSVGYDAGGITFVVPRRNNGPLVDVDIENKVGISVQYTGWGATHELASFLKINESRNMDDFENALQSFDFGSQNFGYADSDGNIAYFASAEMPLREDLQTMMTADGGRPPWMIRDGSGALAHEWMPLSHPQAGQALPYEILPWDEMPHSINPDNNYLANANNDPVGTTLDNNPLNQLRPEGGLYYLNPFYASYRIGRVDREMQKLVSQGDVTTADLMEVQHNNQILDAELITPHILDAVRHAQEADAWPGLIQLLEPPELTAFSFLEHWDFSTPTGIQEGYDPGDNAFALAAPSNEEIDASVAATIFALWRSRFMANTIDGTLKAIGLGDYLPSNRLAYNSIKHHLDVFDTQHGVGASGISFFNVPGAPSPEDARDYLILLSLSEALEMAQSDEFAPAFGNSDDIRDYRWGKLHRIVFDHPLGAPFSIPNYGPFTDLAPELPGLARSGGYESVDASRHSARADALNEFMFGAGPARRFVGELAPEGIVGYEVIPGGQSGNILSPAYANELGMWLTNSYHPMLISDEDVAAGTVTTIDFSPLAP
ncbi:MAG: penicillin acylase family protein [bacterium]